MPDRSNTLDQPARAPLLRTVLASRYVTPFREGGSVPALVEADDDGLYVLKFRGASQGPRVLVAELIAGEIGRLLGLRVPEIVYVELDAALGRSEPDPELQIPIKASIGLNLGLDFLPGSLTFDPAAARRVEQELASAIVWFDAYVMNVDRTARNTNMLTWGKHLWLIDHGASLYFHHGSYDFAQAISSPFAPIRNHVLLPYAAALAEADRTLRPRLTAERLAPIVEAVPDSWLESEPGAPPAAEQRAAYLAFLTQRLEVAQVFVEEALHARSQLI
ncbi:MAG TPA: HipA family kinase [Ktedonobacterales bacterium]|jgi:hypothetical protein|nr:HipA family kinase [Ktedonobacterales bacterium]